MATNLGNTPEPEEPSFSVPIIAHVTFYTASPGNSVKKKVTKRDTKTKEFVHIFCATRPNYLEFLSAILAKHHISSKLQITDCRRYTCKMQVPPSNKGDACDVENFSEYEDVVKKVLERQPTRAIMVFVDMKDVDKAAKKIISEDPEDEGGDKGQSDDSTNGLSRTDAELARLRGMLEKKYANDHDASYTYIDPVTSNPISLTPFMMKEWVRALYDRTVTLSYPPSTSSFDAMNHKPPPTRRHHPASSPALSNVHGISGDLAHISQIISSVASIAHAPSKPPTTPTRPRTSLSASAVISPTRNTPSKLSQFLEYAETVLSVENARTYEESLRIQGFGPDILHLVDDSVLKDVGFTPGDVIHLKQNSQQWWNSADAKRKWSSQMPPLVQTTPPNKRVTFKK